MSEWLENKEGEEKRGPEPSKCQHIRGGQEKNQGWTFGVCVSPLSESKSIDLTMVPPPTPLPLVLCTPAGTTPRGLLPVLSQQSSLSLCMFSN